VIVVGDWNVIQNYGNDFINILFYFVYKLIISQQTIVEFPSATSSSLIYEFKFHTYWWNTSVIVVGDWNVIQNYDKDTINYQSENNRRSRAQIKGHQIPMSTCNLGL
jgi:hypothetical protein